MIDDDSLRALPKAHLHLHLTGSLRPATFLELVRHHRPDMTDVAEQAVHGATGGWSTFHPVYELARALIGAPEDLARIVLERASDDRGNGCRWIEMHVTPSGYVPRLGGLADVIAVASEAATVAEQRTGVGVRLVIGVDRSRSVTEAEAVAQLAVEAAQGGGPVVGLGLCGLEQAGDTKRFAPAFATARAGGLLSLPHAGEMAGAPAVLATVEDLWPQRIGHGVRASEDPSVLARLAQRRIACEVCPAANVALGVYATLRDVPIRALDEACVPVVLGADDPLFFGTDLLSQYRTARDVHGYGASGLARFARASFEHSSMPSDRRAGLLAEVNGWEAAAAQPTLG